MKESRWRSLLKGITWRITGTLDTFVISYLITGKIKTAVSISAVEVITKVILFYGHERVWEKVKWGKKRIDD